MSSLSVLIIIAILAAIAIVAYSGVTSKAHLTAVKSDLVNGYKTLGVYQVSNGTFPSSLSAAGFTPTSGDAMTYNVSGDNSSYCLQASGWGYTYVVSNSNNVPASGSCNGAVTSIGTAPVAMTNGSYIQTVTSANCPSTATWVIDARDNHTYWVQKLADGQCWMLTNLAYAGGGTNTYGDVKSLSNDASSSSYTAPVYYVPSGANPTTSPTTPSTSTNGSGQYGYLYNWCAAMGGQATAACANSLTPAVNSSISVCPAGWQLPTGNGGQFAALNTAVNGGSTSNDAGLLSTWLGQYGGSWQGSYMGNGGVYWSSTPLSSDPTSAYDLWIPGSHSVVTNDSSPKNMSFAVRCVAD